MRTLSLPVHRAFCLSFAALILLGIAPGAHARILRVMGNAPGPAHDGATWASAFIAVQTAIDAAAAGDEVWAAAGTYKERLNVKNGVALYGGFAGIEAARDQRNVLLNRTVLDGDGKGCVVTFQGGAKEDTRLDGFTVTGGKAINGAGIACTAASPTLANNSIVGNISTGWAGGLECFGGSPTVVGNLFTGNFAGGVLGDGGAIHVTRGGAPLIAGNVFRGNIASQNGGAISIFHSSPTILSNTFRGNVSYVLSVGSTGGYSSRAAIGGGAIFGTATDEDYKPVLYGKCEPVIANNVVEGNSGDYATGGICLIDAVGSSALVANNTIVSNSGAGIGWGSTAPRFVNNIIAFNLAGLYHMNTGASTAALRNNCVYHNGTVFARGDYLNIPDPTGADGNLATDPRLASLAAGNAHIQPGSPCVGAGDATIIGQGWTDVDGQARLVGAVDIGADESDGTVWNDVLGRVFVRADGNDANSGESWALAKKSIQAAADLASVLGGEVWVKAGTYNERFILRPYAYLYGGFEGNEAALAERDPVANETIVDGRQGGSVVTMEGGYLVSRLDGFVVRNGRAADDGGGLWVSVASPYVLNNRIEDNSAVNDGGGIGILSAHPILVGNVIRRNRTLNTVSGKGGGVDCTLSSPILMNNEIGGNYGMSGTGFNAEYSEINLYGGFFGPVIQANYIHDNTSASPLPFLHANDGGLRLIGSSVVLLGNTITANVAQTGGGISMSDCGGRIANNLIIGNHATMTGGGISIYYSRKPLSIESNTIAGNVCDGDMWHEWGGAMCVTMLYTDIPAPAIANNIMAYNSSGVFRYPGAGAMPDFRNNCVWSNTGGGLDYDFEGCPDPTGQNGNLRADPKFVSLNPADVHLAAGSPGIDAGNDAFPRLGDCDWDGRPRIIGAHTDIGALEAGPIAPYTLDDLRRCLRILAGLDAATLPDAFRLNLAPAWPPPDRLELPDALALARRLSGL